MNNIAFFSLTLPVEFYCNLFLEHDVIMYKLNLFVRLLLQNKLFQRETSVYTSKDEQETYEAYSKSSLNPSVYTLSSG